MMNTYEIIMLMLLLLLLTLSLMSYVVVDVVNVVNVVKSMKLYVVVDLVVESMHTHIKLGAMLQC